MITVKLYTADVKAAIRELSYAIRSNTVMPALEYIHVNAFGNHALLRSTDLNLDIMVRISCEGEGAFLLPYAEFNKLMPTITEDAFTFEVNENRIKLYADGDIVELPTEDVTGYPELKDNTEESAIQEFGIKPDIIEALKQAINHANDEQTKPMLNGCCIDFQDNGTCNIVGTTGSVIYCKNLPYRGNGKYHIPTAFVKAVNAGQKIKLTDRAVYLTTSAEGRITCILPETDFVDYSAAYLAYQKQEPNIKLKLSGLLPKLNRILSLSDSSTCIVVLKFGEEGAIGSYVTLNYVNLETNKQFSSGVIGCVNNSDVKELTFNTQAFKAILLSTNMEDINIVAKEESKIVYIVAGENVNVIARMQPA